MKQILKTLKKHWITIWLVIAALVCTTVVTLAAYTEVSSVKRVVSTKPNPQFQFSSNIMRKGGSRKQMSTTAYTVTVCNYDQDYPTAYNQSDIRYKLTATLKYKIGDEPYSYAEILDKFADSDRLEEYKAKFAAEAKKYGIHMISDDAAGDLSDNYTYFDDENAVNYTIVFNDDSRQKLATGESNTDRYEVTIPEIPDGVENFSPEFFVNVEASPSSPDGLNAISTLLYRSSSEETHVMWEGHLLEEETSTKDYDFYNYILTGNGEGTVDVLWDPDKFMLNPLFTNVSLSKNSFKDGTTPVSVTAEDMAANEKVKANWVKLTLIVNPFDTTDSNGNTVKGKSRYEVQLYKKLEDTSYTGDNDADLFITYIWNEEE